MTTTPKPLTPPKTRAQGGNTTDLKLWLHDVLSQGPLRIRDIYARAGWTAEGDTKQIENALQRLKSDQNVRCVNGIWGLPDADFGPVVPPPVAPVPRVQPVKAEPSAHVDAKTQAEHHATRAYLREQLAKIAGVPKAALAGLQDDQLAHAAHAQVERWRSDHPAPLITTAPAPVAADSRGQVAGRALVALAVDVGMAAEDASGTAPAKLAEFVQRAINDLRAEGDEADAALKAAVAERNVALQESERRSNELEAVAAQLATIEAHDEDLGRRLATAQDVIRRLEQDIAAANKEAADLRDTLIDVCGKADPAAEAQRAEPILPGWWDPDTRQPFPEWKVVHVVEIEESQKYLRDAQREIQRLEGLLRRTEAQRQAAETHARTPCQRYDEVVDDVWHELASDLRMLITGGESTGAEIALSALSALHEANKFLLRLRAHHHALVGDEVAA